MKRASLIFLASWAVCAGAAAQQFTLEARLILASNESLPLDHRLDDVEFKLRRVFGFENYTHYGEGTALVTAPSRVTIELGHGYRLDISVEANLHAEIRWLQGDTNLLSTRVALKRGVPTILGGPPHEGGNLIVALVAK